MISIINNSTSPYFNLALEEYVLKHLDIEGSLVILWQNEPSVIIGRNQNTIEEINSRYIRDHSINVVRRLSGGGAVYHDLGNLNFTFVTKKSRNNISNFQKFTEPVIKTLNSLGVPAEFSGRNDITIEGKKFSGNAQYFYKDKLLHHGTILFNSDLSVVQEALKVRVDKIQSKGIKSIRSRVTNIFPYLKIPITLKEFQELLTKTIFDHNSKDHQSYVLKEKDIQIINSIMDKRYKKWEWNYGESPSFALQKTRRYPGGTLDIRMDIKDGIINNCKIYGDFFGELDTQELSNQLKSLKLEESSVLSLLNQIDFPKYFHHITKEEFIDCLFY